MTGITYPLYNDLIYKGRENVTPCNILVAGMAGSGKSGILNGMINSILYCSNADHKMILIDPKMVEFSRYEECPHVLTSATSPDKVDLVLWQTIELIQDRLEYMKSNHLRVYDGSIVHVFVDEMADLLLVNKSAANALQRICQLGRAAKVQVICATQCPLASVIPTRVKVNFGITIGLHTASAQHSRNILEVAGCEELPMFGEALIARPGHDIERISIPWVSDEELDYIVQYRTT